MTYRRLDDYATHRRNIFNRVLETVRRRYPISNDRYELHLADVAYDKPRDFSLKEQKQALLSNGSLHWKLKGTWRLVDKATGKVVDERQAVVAHVPYLTQRGSYIHNGNEYTIANQMRLRPGVYAHRRQNKELTAQFNVAPGTGRGFSIQFSPEKRVFYLRIGQSSVPLYSVLSGFGVSDAALEKAWGKELININRQHHDPQAFTKVYQRLANGQAADYTAQRKELEAIFNKMGLDDEVVYRNLGKELGK